ncbi:MAG: YigZ family protein [Synergistaceae bacterium]|nr:YigZ family protein [Synergistaceae bacterium]
MGEREDRFLEPASETDVEITEKRSRFVAAVRVARTPLEAKETIRNISSARPDANHHCWAYRVGLPPSEYYSDAGEPSGTAGKPILGAIQRAGTTNTVVVVTRYFGGIKLGVRGLIEAYGACARKALQAAGTVARVAVRTALIRVSYEEQGNLRFYLREIGVEAESVSCRYEEKVIMEVPVPLSMEERAQVLFGSLLARGQVLGWEWR